MQRKYLIAFIIVCVPTEAFALEQQEGAGYGAALVAGDFDCDGRADLAVGVPYQTVDGFTDTGAVHIWYGANPFGGKFVGGNHSFSQASAGVPAVPEDNDNFGSVLAAGNFDNDGCDDLVIGTPFESIGTNNDAGVVHVMYGGTSGLSTNGIGYFHQDSPGIAGAPGTNDRFGSALAAGDFNDDGYDDLAIGVYGERVDDVFDAGQVHILYGGSSGLTTTGNQIFNQSTQGIVDIVESGDHFGITLAVGNFAGAAAEDLAIGITGENSSAGAVAILRGSTTGLTVTSSEFWTQNSANVANSSQDGDHFGYALASGNFNADGFDDLAIGVPFEKIGTIVGAGAVHTFHGASGGMTPVGFFSQDTTNINGVAEADDYLGWSLATGDFDIDGRDDLAIGVPWEDADGHDDAGAINVLYGSSSGISTNDDELFHQGVSGVSEFVYGHIEANDRFGWALTAGAFFNSFGEPSLAASAMYESVQGVSYSGMVNVMAYGGQTYNGGLAVWADWQDDNTQQPLD